MVLAWARHGSNALLVAALAVLAALFAFHAIRFVWFALPVGAAAFFVNEYTTHRFAFHAPPSKIPFVLALQHRLHYDHHVEPDRIDLLFLPYWFVIPTALAFFAVFALVTRDLGAALSLLAGALLALTYYEWVHYVAHVPYAPRTRWARWMKKYHLWHHFKNEHLWYGVTNPSMDVPFRTYARVDAVDRSATTRKLFG